MSHPDLIAPAPWPTERIAEQFRTEIRQRFEDHNRRFRARDETELAGVLEKRPDLTGAPGFHARDSIAWEVYQTCQIKIESNEAFVLFSDRTLNPDIIPLFAHTSVAWSRPEIMTIMIDGVPRIGLVIMLVATWTDELEQQWREGRRVTVDLYEDEVDMLTAIVDRMVDFRGKRSLRERLALSLEAIP